MLALMIWGGSLLCFQLRMQVVMLSVHTISVEKATNLMDVQSPFAPPPSFGQEPSSMSSAVRKSPRVAASLASQATWSRMENGPKPEKGKKIGENWPTGRNGKKWQKMEK